MKSRSLCLGFGTSLTSRPQGTQRHSTIDWNIAKTSLPHWGS
jgi:hypothetical protein